jgi:hypothetical protein
LVQDIYIRPPWTAERIEYTPGLDDLGKIRVDLISTWQDGLGLVLYSGHASVHQWGAENFIHIEEVPLLSNNSRLPVLLEMTCFTSSFHVPAFPTLDESMVRSPAGGAVAAWGSTGLGVAAGHTELAEGFVQEVLYGEVGDLGTAALAGKIMLAARQPAHLDLVDTFTLLGDPAMRLHGRSIPSAIYIPSLWR